MNGFEPGHGCVVAHIASGNAGNHPVEPVPAATALNEAGADYQVIDLDFVDTASGRRS